MTAVVSIPKKLRDVFELLCKGKIKEGIEQLKAIPGFEAHKAIALAEIAYFQHDFESAMDYDEQALPHHEEWYAGNIVNEHFFAYVRAAIALKCIDRAKRVLTAFLKREQDTKVPANDMDRHKFHVERYQYIIGQHLLKLKGRENLEIYNSPYQVISNGDSMDKFIAQLKKYRPKFLSDSIDGAMYMLNFIYKTGNTTDYVKIYEKFSDKIDDESLHIKASKVYLALKHPEKAKEAIRTLTSKAWFPIEHPQITPMKLWAEDDLQKIMKRDFCKEILYLPKVQNR